MKECEKCEEGIVHGTCGTCAGSGEGMADGTTCRSCGGGGAEDWECDECDGTGEVMCEPKDLVDSILKLAEQMTITADIMQEVGDEYDMCDHVEQLRGAKDCLMTWFIGIKEWIEVNG